MIVSWNHVPVSEAKGIIVSYRVSYYAISDDKWETTVRNDLAVPGSDNSVLIGGLSPSKSYQVFVLASTSAGDGAYDETPAIAITGMVHAQCHFQCAVDYCMFIFGTFFESMFNCLLNLCNPSPTMCFFLSSMHSHHCMCSSSFLHLYV